MTLRQKLVVAFAIVLVLVGAQTGVAVLVLTQVVAGSARLVPPALSRVDALAHLESEVLRLRALEYSLIWSGGTAVGAQLAREMASLRASIQRRMAEYGTHDLDDLRAASLSRIQQHYGWYLASQQQVAEAVERDDQAEALWEYLRFQASFQSLDDQLHSLRHQEYAATEILRGEMVQAALAARWPLGVTVVLVALAAVGLGWYVSQSIALGLATLQQGARRIAEERFDEPVPAPPERELAALADTLNAVMAALAAHKAERARLEEERLRLLRERLSQVVRAQEEERARVSRELHDQAGQALIALKYGLSRVQGLSQDPAVMSEIGDLVALATKAGRQIRALAHGLRPAVLDDLGLLPALRSAVREFSERIAIPIELAAASPIPRLSPDAETTVFRVVQEALTNVAKHAGAHHVWVTMAVQHDQLQVQVRDDGRGFCVPGAPSLTRTSSWQNGLRPGLGLAGIEERVRLLGGRVEITSEAGRGTCLSVSFPLAQSK